MESGWSLCVWLVGVHSNKWVWLVGGIYGSVYQEVSVVILCRCG